MNYLLSLTRWRVWYRSKVPLFLACMYWAVLSRGTLTIGAAVRAGALLALFCLLACFGHMVNSLSDREIDQAAGKGSPLASSSTAMARLIVAAPAVAFLAGAVILYWHRPLVIALFYANLALAIFYSLPPLRLKERGVAGLLASAVAQRSLPAVIIFEALGAWNPASVWLCVLSTFIGIRAILWHQVLDYAGDAALGVRTFVVDHGKAMAVRAIKVLVFPLEVVSLVATAVSMAPTVTAVAYVIVLYELWMARRVLRGRQSLTHFLTKNFGVYDKFYDVALPLLLAAALAWRNVEFVPAVVFTYLWVYFGNEAAIARRLRKVFSKSVGISAIGAGRPGSTFVVRPALRMQSPGRTTIDRTRARAALSGAIDALQLMQNSDGSFPLCFIEQGSDWRPCHPVFSTVTVALAVGHLLPAESIAKAVDFVLGCRCKGGLWEFDPALGIPTDADTTSCSLSVLARHRPEAVSSNDAALLRSFWREDGGPFRTWSDRGKMWNGRDRDDAVVNGNVLCALRALGAAPSSGEVEAALQLARQSLEGTRYYCSYTTVGYALRRGGVALAEIPQRLMRRPSEQVGLLTTAQWLSTAQIRDDAAASFLIENQLADGTWPVEGWFTAEARVPIIWGGAAVSTALCAEALATAVNDQVPPPAYNLPTHRQLRTANISRRLPQNI